MPNALYYSRVKDADDEKAEFVRVRNEGVVARRVSGVVDAMGSAGMRGRGPGTARVRGGVREDAAREGGGRGIPGGEDSGLQAAGVRGLVGGRE